MELARGTSLVKARADTLGDLGGNRVWISTVDDSAYKAKATLDYWRPCFSEILALAGIF